MIWYIFIYLLLCAVTSINLVVKMGVQYKNPFKTLALFFIVAPAFWGGLIALVALEWAEDF